MAIQVPAWRELHERHLAALRARLDTDELGAAWEAGRTMMPEEALAEALAENG